VPLRARIYHDLDAPPPERPTFVPSSAPREAPSSHARSVRGPAVHIGDVYEPSSARARRRTPYAASLPTWQSGLRRPPRTEQRAPRLERSPSRSAPRDGPSRAERGTAARERSPGSSRSRHPPLEPLSSLSRDLSSPLPPRTPFPPLLHRSPPSPLSQPSPPPAPRLPSRLSSPSDPSPPWLADALYGPSFVEVERWFRDAEVRDVREGVEVEGEGEGAARRAVRTRKREREEEEAGGGEKRRGVRGGERKDVVNEEGVMWLDLTGWEAEWRRRAEGSVRGALMPREVRSWT